MDLGIADECESLPPLAHHGGQQQKLDPSTPNMGTSSSTSAIGQGQGLLSMGDGEDEQVGG